MTKSTSIIFILIFAVIFKLEKLVEICLFVMIFIT